MIAELMPRVGDVQHDEQTRRLYPRAVAAECTCGFHSPPPGLADNPEAHIEGCGYRAAMAQIVNPVLMVPNACGEPGLTEYGKD